MATISKGGWPKPSPSISSSDGEFVPSMKQAGVAQEFCGSDGLMKQNDNNSDHLSKSPTKDQVALTPTVEAERPNFDLIFESFAKSAGIEIFSIQRHSALKGVVQAIHAYGQTIQGTQPFTQLDLDLTSQPIHGLLDSTIHHPQLTDAISGVWSSAFDHPFLKCNSTDKLSRTELLLLEDTGCFRVPKDDYLASFIREYFLYIHHMLPILDEKDFGWALTKTSFSSQRLEPVSIFLLQAILAASCVVSHKFLQFYCPPTLFCVSSPYLLL